MRTWDQILVEPVSLEHETQIMSAVQIELEKNAAGAGRRVFNWNLLGGLGLLSVAVFGVYHMVRNAIGTYHETQIQMAEQSETMDALTSLEVASDFDLVNDLDVLEDLDDLENWNGVDV